ncbi:MAG: hypothetical protein M1820_009201 [Bogoriella megaspora]|nr:MAG: hypothetical protein M1820_009201 [Bogoriella megaspora]
MAPMAETDLDVMSASISNPQINFKKRSAKATRKRAPTPDPDDNLDDSASSSENGLSRIKRRRNVASRVTNETFASPSLNSLKAALRETELARGTPKSSALHSGKSQTTTTFGPVRGPSNVRITTITDYQPDVCKDYKVFEPAKKLRKSTV